MKAWVALLLASSAACASAPPVRHYKLVTFPDEAIERPILGGAPETGGMRSGYVALKAGEDMHRHSTGTNEELLVILRGKGEVVVGAERVAVVAGQALYIPPGTEHEVHASGGEELRYVYTVAPAK